MNSRYYCRDSRNYALVYTGEQTCPEEEVFCTNMQVITIDGMLF